MSKKKRRKKMEEPLFTKCNKCGAQIEVTPRLVVLYVYKRQPWFSWMAAFCEKCNRESDKFFGPKNWEKELRWYLKREFPIVEEDFCPEKIVREFEGVYDLKLISERQLTPRQEHQVAFFAYLLETDRWEMA